MNVILFLIVFMFGNGSAYAQVNNIKNEISYVYNLKKFKYNCINKGYVNFCYKKDDAYIPPYLFFYSVPVIYNNSSYEDVYLCRKLKISENNIPDDVIGAFLFLQERKVDWERTESGYLRCSFPEKPSEKSSDLDAVNFCNDLYRRVSDAVSAKIYRRTDSSMFLTVSGFEGIQIACARKYLNRSLAHIFISNDSGAAPPKWWWNLFSNAGAAFSKTPARQIESAGRRCVSKALRDQSEHGEISGKGFKIECRAFRRDGGGVAMSLFNVE